jgi:hypothetical protein
LKFTKPAYEHHLESFSDASANLFFYDKTVISHLKIKAPKADSPQMIRFLKKLSFIALSV